MSTMMTMTMFLLLISFVSTNPLDDLKDCQSPSDCSGGDPLVTCVGGRCSCPNSSLVLVQVNDDKVKCLSGVKTGSHCNHDKECLLQVAESFCHYFICRRCSDVDGSFWNEVNVSCILNGTKVSSDGEVNTAILPILIGMGLMFIGMCAALNMMSRARFKNHRGVFNQPNAGRVLKDVQVTHEQQRAKKSRRHSSRPSVVEGNLDTLDPNQLTLVSSDGMTPRESRPSSMEGRRSPAHPT